MTQANESLDLTAADHIRAFNRHAQKQIFDYALINRTPVSEELKPSMPVKVLPDRQRSGCHRNAGRDSGSRRLYLDKGGVARHNTPG